MCVHFFSLKCVCVGSVEGLIDVNMTEIPMEETELKFTKFFGVEFGGHWKPKDCIPHWKVRLGGWGWVGLGGVG